MKLDFFGRRRRIVDVKVDGDSGHIEKKYRWVIPIIILAIGILTFWDFGGGEEEKGVSEPVTENIADGFAEKEEEKLEAMLSSIRGAGSVKAMIVFDYKTEKVLASNKTTQKESQIQNETTSTKTSDEESVILFGSGSQEQPYVLKEKLPVPTGVFVTATGAADENVKLEIYEAVKALYGVSGHRVKVASGKE